MARYVATYYGDNGKVYDRIVSDIYTVTVSVGIRGTRDYTTYEQDNELVPLLVLEALTPLSPKQSGCTLPFNERFLVLWTGNDTYIHCPFPFAPGSLQANSVLEALKTTFKFDYLDFGLKSEFIPASYLEWSVNYG